MTILQSIKIDNLDKNIKINTILMFLLRGGGILCNLFLIPLTLNYLDKSNYGVWLTLTSIISWLSFMDVGLGNGMRNKLTESLGAGDRALAKEYVSTTYILFSAIIFSTFFLFAIVNPFINWNKILKSTIENADLIILCYIVVFSFSARLILDLAGTISLSLQKPFIRTLLDFLFNFVTLIVVFILTKTEAKSLLLFGSIASIIPVLVLLIFSWILFRKKSKYHFLVPSIQFFRKKHFKALFNLGSQFFIIQLAGLIVFSTDNILITQFFSPSEVTNFNIVYKYFSIITMLFNIILTPYWSSFTAAFISNDFIWIKSTFKKLLSFWSIHLVLVVIFIVIAPYVYTYWIGDALASSYRLNLWLGIYVVVFNWNNVFVYFLNGVSKIKLQLYSSIAIGVLNIPVAIFLTKYTSLGPSSIVISNIVCLLICSLWSPIQCYKLINKTAKGIWNK